MQREILDQAANLLKPGGTMLYSTCTFSKLENEGSMDYFLSNHPEFHLLDIPQSEGFAPGQPELVDSTFPLEKCVRLFPHKIDGEGHFLLASERWRAYAKCAGVSWKTVEASAGADRFSERCVHAC